MEVIASFQVDHSNLKPGIYLSRRDEAGNGVIISTFDIRMTAPNHEPAIDVAALHTIEHLVATFLRNHPLWKERIVYWGPMGCLTGNYLIVKGEYEPTVIRDLMIESFEFVASFEGEVPGTTAATCGNYLMHNLPMARWEAARYLKRLKEEFCYDYPGIVRPVDNSGNSFFDA